MTRGCGPGGSYTEGVVGRRPTEGSADVESNRWAHPARTRAIFAGVLAVFLIGVVALAMNAGTPRPHGSNGFTTTTLTSPYGRQNLPPSRDNDAGRARSLDLTPDNDTDAWQRG